MFALLPWPYVGKFIRRSTPDSNRVINEDGEDSFAKNAKITKIPLNKNVPRLASEEAI
jgi:hypothetical protein